MTLPLTYPIVFTTDSVFYFRSEHVCQVSLIGGLLSRSQCQEEHTFKPFSSGQSGAVTTQLQKLTFVSSTTKYIQPLTGIINIF